ncbi:30S ribosomal protein S2 [Candidatus Kaiserbacteria bacterium]|nr:30S ribosomal protein S2 [Candidatus Kaiserbacteria bacterium]
MSNDIQTLFEAGAHFGYARTRRHPSAAPYLFGTKDRTDIFDLEETGKRLAAAIAFASALAAGGKQILFVGGKHEVLSIVRSSAEAIGMPFVAGRWIGGTLTNFKGIRKRIDRLEKLTEEREKGELEKYTKKERLLIDREINELAGRFGGLTKMTDLPAALFVVDTRHESTAVQEAVQLGIPVIGLASSDCDFSLITYPVPGNDTSIRSVRLVVEAIAEGYAEGKRAPAASKSTPKATA